jgi:quercetin dioxygenase-like cupin family protein
MSGVFRADPADLDWSSYDGADGRGRIRFKALTAGVGTVTRVQYIEYAPEHCDPVHRHAQGEVFIVSEGELWLDGKRSGPGSILCIPRDTDYAVRSGPRGARFFRVVVP